MVSPVECPKIDISGYLGVGGGVVVVETSVPFRFPVIIPLPFLYLLRADKIFIEFAQYTYH